MASYFITFQKAGGRSLHNNTVAMVSRNIQVFALLAHNNRKRSKKIFPK